MTTAYLRLPHLRVHNANALSSPLTIGFPALTAWLGAIHLLQRRMQAEFERLEFTGVGIASHTFRLHTFRGSNDFVTSIIGTANPLDKTGTRPSFIEEPRCSLDVSLALETCGIKPSEHDRFIQRLSHHLYASTKIAGGDLLSFDAPRFYPDFDKLKSALMPSYVLIERRDLLEKAMGEGEDALDAIIDYTAIHHSCEMAEDEHSPAFWSSTRKESGPDGQRGWLVPIAVGFHGISPLGNAKNQRDPNIPHRFAEAVISLGEFKMTYRLQEARQLFWRYRYEEENNLYLCHQDNVAAEGSWY